jgi:hypothetical protein
MTSYNLCAECDGRRDARQHRVWSSGSHRFVDPRRAGQPVPVRTMSRYDLTREGWVEVNAPTPDMKVGDQAVVYARGDLRLGVIDRIGRTTVYVAVATPTSPDLITNGKIGGAYRSRGYIRPPVVDCSLPGHVYTVGAGNFSRCECGHGRHSDCHR